MVPRKVGKQRAYGEPNITEDRLQLKCSKTYEIMIIAWNERGSSKADGETVHMRTEKGI